MLPPAALHEAPNHRPLPLLAQVDVARRQDVSRVVQDEAFVDSDHSPKIKNLQKTLQNLQKTLPFVNRYIKEN